MERRGACAVGEIPAPQRHSGPGGLLWPPSSRSPPATSRAAGLLAAVYVPALLDAGQAPWVAIVLRILGAVQPQAAGFLRRRRLVGALTRGRNGYHAP